MNTKALFTFIKTMTGPEKRYHRLTNDLQQNSQENQINQLFDLLVKMKNYNKEALTEKLEKAGLSQNESALKFKLEQQILRSLRLFHEGKSNRMQILQHAIDIEILYKRGLYEQAFSVLEKAKKKAIVFQDSIVSPILAQWEIELHRALFYTGIDFEYLIQWSSKFMEDLKNLELETQQQKLHAEIYLVLREHGIIRGHELEIKMASYLSRIEELENIEKLTIETKRLELMVRFIYHYTRNETQELLTISQGLSALFTDNPVYAVEHPERFISAMNNYAIVLSNLKLGHLVPKVVEQIRAITPASAHNRTLLFISSTILELNHIISFGDFKKGLAAAIKAGKQLNNSVTLINEDSRIHLLYDIAFIHFGAGEYDQAIPWIQKVINSPGIKNRKDIAIGAQILQIVLQLELENLSVVESRSKSLLRQLNNMEGEFRFEKVLVYFLNRKIPSCNNQKELTDAYLELLNKLKELSKDRMEKIALKGFDYISWLESKVSGKDFGEILFEKNKLS